jgi:hypothetical protein
VGFFDSMKERTLSGTIYALYSSVQSRYPRASEADLLAETFKLRLKKISKKYPGVDQMSDEDIRRGLNGINSLDELVEFIIGFERKAEEFKLLAVLLYNTPLQPTGARPRRGQTQTTPAAERLGVRALIQKRGFVWHGPDCSF